MHKKNETVIVYIIQKKDIDRTKDISNKKTNKNNIEKNEELSYFCHKYILLIIRYDYTDIVINSPCKFMF